VARKIKRPKEVQCWRKRSCEFGLRKRRSNNFNWWCWYYYFLTLLEQRQNLLLMANSEFYNAKPNTALVNERSELLFTFICCFFT